MNKRIVLMMVIVGVLVFGMVIGMVIGWVEGVDEGARAMARHILHPKFKTDKFDALVEEEVGNDTWERRALRWQVAAEHYGGICKWFLSDKPIYGTIEMGDNTTLRDCLIVSGSKEASVIAGGNDILIANNDFRAIAMDWVNSLTVVDPNEAEKLRNEVTNDTTGRNH